MPEVFHVPLPEGTSAAAVEVTKEEALAPALRQLGLRFGRPTLVIVGGAGKLADEDAHRLRALFEEQLGPLCAAHDVVVVAGGTDAGVMRLAGQARARAGGRFDLVGVAAVGTVVIPGRAAQPPEGAALEGHHSHFVLVPGAEWGAEAPWIARVATAIAGDKPSATLLINGGEIAWQDAAESVTAGRPVLVVAGSGRTADVLARAAHGVERSQRADALIDTGLIQVLDLNDDPRRTSATLRDVLGLPNDG